MKNFFQKRKNNLKKKDNLKPNNEINDIKKHLDEHLQAINENTCEIQSNHDFLVDIENKIHKLSERIDQIQLFLQSNSDFSLSKVEKFDIEPLTRNEQYVFLVLYALEEEMGYVSYNDIAKKTGFSISLVMQYVSSIIEKGVPIIKRYINQRPYMNINKEFKRLQAKENILEIDTAQKQLLNF